MPVLTGATKSAVARLQLRRPKPRRVP